MLKSRLDAPIVNIGSFRRLVFHARQEPLDGAVGEKEVVFQEYQSGLPAIILLPSRIDTYSSVPYLAGANVDLKIVPAHGVTWSNCCAHAKSKPILMGPPEVFAFGD